MLDFCFYHHVCQWCGLQDQIKKCSSCRLVSYCSEEHQKFDWHNHKILCKVIKKLRKEGNSLFTFQEKTETQWVQLRTNFMLSVEIVLGRKLEVFERQMILFPNVCSVCYKDSSHFLPCKKCNCTFYCSEEHLISDILNHKKSCNGIKLCFEIDLCSRQKYVDKKICWKQETREFPSDMKSYIKALECDGSSDLIMGCLASEGLSFILTLIHALIKMYGLNLPFLVNLEIHIVGAGDQEDRMINLIETIFFWFPLLKCISILMIGPECDTECIRCPVSKEYEGNKTLTIRKISKLYHEFVSQEDFAPPHLIAAFNCGFSEFTDKITDTWSLTLQRILNLHNILFILTSYTKTEAKNDLSRVIDNNAHNKKLNFIISGQRNPFRSLRPIRDWESPSQVFYLNNFLTLIFIT